MGLFKTKAVPALSSLVSDPVPMTGDSREDEKQWLRRLDREASGHLSVEEAVERGALVSGREPAPGYTNRLVIIYHRQKRYADEVAIIERWELACPRELRDNIR